jgi:hypothetical protein
MASLPAGAQNFPSDTGGLPLSGVYGTVHFRRPEAPDATVSAFAA